MAVLVHDLFNFLRVNTMPRNMLDVVLVPLCLQLQEPHVLSVSRWSDATLTIRSAGARLTTEAS
jgi:hypothetical protein